MSGRLVILRHKSWHVWNGDNQEKVLRDERLNREKISAAQDYEKKQIQNKTVEALVGSEQLVEQIESKHINFFEDFAPNVPTNEEYRKEKEKQDMAKMKKEGVAPWAFGDGSQEKAKKKAWYETVAPAPTSYSTVDISAPSPPVNLKRKQLEHKEFSDPMRKIIKGSNAAAPISSKPQNIVTASVSSGNHSKTLDSELLISLRRKRLEREKREHKKEQQLLATMDIYGSVSRDISRGSSSQSTRGYNNMYQK